MKILSNEEGKCPICNNINLDYEPISFIDNLCVYRWKCLDCGAEGEEWYELNFIGHNVKNQDDDFIEIKEIGEEI